MKRRLIRYVRNEIVKNKSLWAVEIGLFETIPLFTRWSRTIDPRTILDERMGAVPQIPLPHPYFLALKFRFIAKPLFITMIQIEGWTNIAKLRFHLCSGKRQNTRLKRGCFVGYIHIISGWWLVANRTLFSFNPSGEVRTPRAWQIYSFLVNGSYMYLEK